MSAHIRVLRLDIACRVTLVNIVSLFTVPAFYDGFVEKFSEFVTWNRVSNVISHIGEVTSKDFGKVLNLTMRDIFVEAEREGIEISQAQQPSKLKNELQKMVQLEIRSKWLEIIS